MRLKACAPARLRKQPDTFCCTFIMRRSRSARLLSKSTRRSSRKQKTAFWCLRNRSSRLRAALCLIRPLVPGGGRRSWSDSIPFIKQAEKRGFPIKHFQRIEPALSLFACLLGGLFHREEQVFEIGRPDGSLLLCLKHQLSEEMNQAEGMLACIQEVRSPGIMDADAREDGQDANRVQSVLSSATIHMIMGEGCR